MNTLQQYEDNDDPIDINLKLKNTEQLQERDISTILLTLIHRKRFKYTLIDVLKYIFRCICCRDLKANRHRKHFKSHFLYEKCEEALNMELDIVSLLRQARQTRLLT